MEYFVYPYEIYSPRQISFMTPEKLANPSHLIARGSYEFCLDELRDKGYNRVSSNSMRFTNGHVSVLLAPVQ